MTAAKGGRRYTGSGDIRIEVVSLMRPATVWRALLICKYLILSSPAATIVIVLGFGDVSSRACNATMNQTHVAIRIRRERQLARTIRAERRGTSPGCAAPHLFARIRGVRTMIVPIRHSRPTAGQHATVKSVNRFRTLARVGSLNA